MDIEGDGSLDTEEITLRLEKSTSDAAIAPSAETAKTGKEGGNEVITDSDAFGYDGLEDEIAKDILIEQIEEGLAKQECPLNTAHDPRPVMATVTSRSPAVLWYQSAIRTRYRRE